MDTSKPDSDITSLELRNLRLFSSAAYPRATPPSTSTPSPATLSTPTVHTPSHTPSNRLFAYTDGSKKLKYSSAGWSAVIVERDTHPSRQLDNPGKPIIEQFGKVVTQRSSPFFLGANAQTNNTAELSGIVKALIWFKDFQSLPKRAKLVIITDSQYSIDLLNGTSQPQSNTALVLRCRQLLADCKAAGTEVLLNKITSHTRNKWNDHADRLANLGATKSTKLGRYAPLVASPLPATQTHISPISSSVSTAVPLTYFDHSKSTEQLEDLEHTATSSLMASEDQPKGTSSRVDDPVVETNTDATSSGRDLIAAITSLSILKLG